MDPLTRIANALSNMTTPREMFLVVVPGDGPSNGLCGSCANGLCNEHMAYPGQDAQMFYANCVIGPYGEVIPGIPMYANGWGDSVAGFFGQFGTAFGPMMAYNTPGGYQGYGPPQQQMPYDPYAGQYPYIPGQQPGMPPMYQPYPPQQPMGYPQQPYQPYPQQMPYQQSPYQYQPYPQQQLPIGQQPQQQGGTTIYPKAPVTRR